jgi:hypothetical protein
VRSRVDAQLQVSFFEKTVGESRKNGDVFHKFGTPYLFKLGKCSRRAAVRACSWRS